MRSSITIRARLFEYCHARLPYSEVQPPLQAVQTITLYGPIRAFKYIAGFHCTLGGLKTTCRIMLKHNFTDHHGLVPQLLYIVTAIRELENEVTFYPITW